MTPDSKASWPGASSPSVKNQVLVTRGLIFISMGGKISSRTFLSRAEAPPCCRCPDFLPPHGPQGPWLVSLPAMAVSCSLPACLLPLLFASWSLLGSGPHLLPSRLRDRSHLPPTSDQSNEIDTAGELTSPHSIERSVCCEKHSCFTVPSSCPVSCCEVRDMPRPSAFPALARSLHTVGLNNVSGTQFDVLLDNPKEVLFCFLCCLHCVTSCYEKCQIQPAPKKR